MRSLFAFVGGALIAFLGLGWYFQWYTITKEPGATPGHTRIGIDINTKKVTDDVQKGVETGSKAVSGAISSGSKTP
ncbi:MAG: hypothetical protein K1X57_17010 [Gemmataceae bacterium]|nr:hypothetical protein [Gemmataceae bacterium]